MKKNKPNILLITSDQQHWDTIGRFNKEVKTPNLDRLAKMGTTFNRAYCPNPTSTPSRASIITGMYPSQHGAWALGTKAPDDIETLGDILLEEGYRTSLIGKAHFHPLRTTEEFSSLESYPIMQDLEFWKNFNEKWYGFEHIELTRNHVTESHVGQHYAIWLEENGCENWKDYFLMPTGNMDNKVHKAIEELTETPEGFYNAERTWGEWKIPEKYHYNTWIAERTNAMLDKYKKDDENFFLWASFFDPHPEYFVPEPWASMYDPAEVTLPKLVHGEHDNNPPHFGKTQEIFPDFSEYKETGWGLQGCYSHRQKEEELRKDIALYYGMISMMDKYIGKILDKLEETGQADNTIVIFTTDHGHFYGHHGLVRKAPCHYEDMVRVPFIAKFPNNIPEDKVSESLVSLVDIAPTFLDYAGIKIPNTMTGLSGKETWNGENERYRKHVIVENRQEPTRMNLRTYIDDRYKLTLYCDADYGEIFDLVEDPKEINNLWNNKEFAELKAKLLLKYAQAELEKEPMWMPRIYHA